MLGRSHLPVKELLPASYSAETSMLANATKRQQDSNTRTAWREREWERKDPLVPGTSIISNGSLKLRTIALGGETLTIVSCWKDLQGHLQGQKAQENFSLDL